MKPDFPLSIHKGEVRRYKAAKSSATSAATAPPCLQRQHKAKGGCWLTQRLYHLTQWQLLPFCPQHSSGCRLPAGPGGTGRKPKHPQGHTPSTMSTHSHAGFESNFKGNRGLGTFRGMSQYYYTGLKSILQLQTPRIASEQWHPKYMHGARLGHSLISFKEVADHK